jgi:hypothetical protein
MNKAASVVGAAGIGAGLMYLFDPHRGKRRRAKVRDKAMGSRLCSIGLVARPFISV